MGAEPESPARPAAAPSAPPAGATRLLGPIPQIVTWVGGSLALIGATFYAAGYLAIRAQLRLLGLEGLVSHSQERYVQEGGRFFLELGMELSLLLSLVLLAGVAAGLVALVARSIRAYRRRRQPARAGALRRFVGDHAGRLRQVGFVSLLAGLLVLAQDPEVFVAPLEISGLLFDVGAAATPAAAADGESAALRQLLLSGDEAGLRWRFRVDLGFELLALLLFLAAWRLASGWRLRPLLTLPFALVLVIYTLALPMLYGVLCYREAAPVVRVQASQAHLVDGRDYFLLERSDNEFVFWDPVAREAIWLPFAGVTSATVERIDYLVRPSATP